MLVETGEVHRHYNSDNEEIEIEIINEDDEEDEEAESSYHSKPKQDENKGNFYFRVNFCNILKPKLFSN